MSAIARPPGRHYVIIILLRADLSSVDGRRAPGHHSPGSQRGIRGGTAMPGPPPPPPPLTEPAVCRTGLNNIYHGPSGAPALNWSSGATHGSGPASTPNVTHNRPDSALLPLSLSLFRSRSRSAIAMGSDATLSSSERIVIGCGRAWFADL